jgi:hypothetical protein
MEIIGRAENIAIIDGPTAIPAKIDTGAYRSAIHATNMQIIEKAGVPSLHCDVLAGHPAVGDAYHLETPDFRSLRIKNSTGQVEERYEVRLRIKLGHKIFTTSFSLSDRSNNVYPVLLGRKALRKRFLVDVTQTAVDRVLLKRLAGLVTEDEEDGEDDE